MLGGCPTRRPTYHFKAIGLRRLSSCAATHFSWVAFHPTAAAIHDFIDFY